MPDTLAASAEEGSILSILGMPSARHTASISRGGQYTVNTGDNRGYPAPDTLAVSAEEGRGGQHQPASAGMHT